MHLRGCSNGTEVLPASLVARFEKLAGDDPIAAFSLLVPISYAQFERLRREKQLQLVRGEDYEVWVASVPYDSDYGLNLTAAS